MSTNETSNFREIRIPVPYGFIAAKAWGEENADPVLALHGWQDNAGTFDKLIPMLSPKLYIVAIDAPGHGLSSHKTIDASYNAMEMLVDIKRIVKYLKWDVFSILGHSLGGMLGLLYSSVYPECVKNLVVIDVVSPGFRDVKDLPDETRRGIESILRTETKMSNPAPVYDKKEAHLRLLTGLRNEVTPENIDILLKRGSKPSPCGKGVVFTRDIRVKEWKDLQRLSRNDLIEYMGRIRCNLLIILGKNSIFLPFRTPEKTDIFFKLYKENCEIFELIEVEGNHFVHLNNPDHLAPYINNLFTLHGTKVSKI